MRCLAPAILLEGDLIRRGGDGARESFGRRLPILMAWSQIGAAGRCALATRSVPGDTAPACGGVVPHDLLIAMIGSMTGASCDPTTPRRPHSGAVGLGETRVGPSGSAGDGLRLRRDRDLRSARLGWLHSIDDRLHQRVADDIRAVEQSGRRRRGSGLEPFDRVGQPAAGGRRKVHLRDVAGDDDPRVLAHPRQEHLHLGHRRILALVEDDHGVVQRAPRM